MKKLLESVITKVSDDNKAERPKLKVIAQQIQFSEDLSSYSTIVQFYKFRFKILNIETKEESFTPWYFAEPSTAEQIPQQWDFYIDQVKAATKSH